MKKRDSKLRFTDEELRSYQYDDSESEDENISEESVRTVANETENGMRIVRSAYRREQRYSEPKTSTAYSSNPNSRLQQKRTVKKKYSNRARGKQSASKASDTAVKASQKAVEKAKKTGEFIVRHKKEMFLLGALLFVMIFALNVASSCSVMTEGLISAIGATTYPIKDEDMKSAETEYVSMENHLQEQINDFKMNHSYDEYSYDLDPIGHDPYVLISAVTALHNGEWTIEEISDTLSILFSKQYILTDRVVREVRYQTEIKTGYYSFTDPETEEEILVPYEYEKEVPYNYYICYVTLTAKDLETVALGLMTEEQKEMYEVYMLTNGNRPDLFN